MRPKRTSLRVEGLETRENLSVAVAVVASDLFVTGDAASDQVQLSRLANGAVRVQGLNGTLVNGGTFVDRTFTDDLLVDLGAGHNVLLMSEANGGLIADDVDIRTGNGVDWIVTHRLRVVDDIVIDTGEGADYVRLNGVTASNRDNPPNDVGEDGISVYTRGGGDTVSIYNSFSAEDVTVVLDPSNLDTPGFGDWRFTVALDPSNLGAPGFSDTLSMDSVRAGDDFFLYGFGGNDRMSLNNLTAGDVLSVSLGAGDDFLKLTNSQARGKTVLGDAGFDTFQYYNGAYIPGTTTGFESHVNAP